MSQSDDNLIAAFEVIQSRGFTDSIAVGIILGSGLASATEGMQEIIAIPYADLPGFPVLSVSDHVPQLVIGTINGVKVACLKGRSHYYETGDAGAMALPLELLAMLGAQHIILTNAATSVNADLVPGTLAVITDHIANNAPNPLVGRAEDGGFISMVDAYDQRMNRRCKLASSVAGITVREGVYMWFSGPSFETPAEARMARTMGADLLGTSTVTETIIARKLGLRVTGISAISAYAPGFRKSNPSQVEQREGARQAAIALRRLLPAFLTAKEPGA